MFSSYLAQGVEVSKAFANGDSYKGQWAGGVPHGIGRYEWKDGSVYDGDWVKGSKHGKGKFTWASGAVYDGLWHQGKMQGVGRLKGPDKSVYVGNFVADVKQGLGTKKYSSGDVYTGFWKGGSAEGQGTYLWANGNGYTGSWVGGRMSGHGYFLWANGDNFEGEWEAGREHGVGLFTWADRSRFEGTWSQGLKDGRGVYYPKGYRIVEMPSNSSSANTKNETNEPKLKDILADNKERIQEALEVLKAESGEEDDMAAKQNDTPTAVEDDGGEGTKEIRPRGIQQFRDVVKRVTDEMDSKLKNIDSLWVSRVAPTPDSASTSLPEEENSSRGGDEPSVGTRRFWETVETVLSLNARSHLVVDPNLPRDEPVAVGDKDNNLSNDDNVLSRDASSLRSEGSASFTHSDSEASTPRVSFAIGTSHGSHGDGLVDLGQNDEFVGNFQDDAMRTTVSSGASQSISKDTGETGEPNSVEAEKSIREELSTVPGGLESGRQNEKFPRRAFSVDSHMVPNVPKLGALVSSVSDIGRRVSEGGGKREAKETATSKHPSDTESNSGLPTATFDPSVPVIREYVQGELISETPLDSRSVSMPKFRRHGTEGKKAGETIFKGHRSYDLMLTLQLGIRHAVGRMTPETMREIQDSDFSSKTTTVRFPSEGTQQTPPHSMQPFRWKDFCPHVFRHLRSMFGIDPSDYMLSLCGNDALREMSSPGKSGSMFFLSHDDRFIIKTMRKSEISALLRMLPDYYRHVQKEENTILTKFFGLHQVKIHLGSKVRFIVMGNLLQAEHRVHRRFDLKGSSQGRSTDKVEIEETTTLKDLDLDLLFYLPVKDRTLLEQQIHNDCRFLEEQGIMDYSLLLGLHFKAVHKPAPFVTISDGPMGSRDPTVPSVTTDGIGKTLSTLVEDPLTPSLDGSSKDLTINQNGQALTKKEMRRGRSMQISVLESTQGTLGQGMEATAVRMDKTVRMPIIDPELSEAYPVVLYFGIIDILQEYDKWKRMEHYVKKLQYDGRSISSVNPKLYAKRFQEFILATFPF